MPAKIRPPHNQKRALVKRAAQQTGIPFDQARILVDKFLQGLIEEICQNAWFDLRGFGTFKVIKKGGTRTIRHPKSGETIEARNPIRIKYRPAKSIIELVRTKVKETETK